MAREVSTPDTRTRRPRLLRTLDVPALHFAAIGVALFLASAYFGVGGTTQGRRSIVIDAQRVAELRRSYVETIGKAPDSAAESHMLAREVDDELLYREALRLGVDRADRTVYWRLVEKMKFLGEAHEGETDDQLFRRALAMGLQEKDPVIRRVLIRKLGMLIRFAGGEQPPSDADLLAYYERHPALYARPERVTFRHVFFSTTRRGRGARADAERALETLRGNDAGAAKVGDPFLAGQSFVAQSREALAKLFGSDFADAVTRAPQGSWQGPIASAYGFHLVEIRERTGGGRSTLESVRSQVAEGLTEERREARLRAKLVELRASYEIRIEGAAVATTAHVAGSATDVQACTQARGAEVPHA